MQLTFEGAAGAGLSGGLANRVAYWTSETALTYSPTTATELGYLSGVTSAVQTQLNAKQATLVSGTNIKTVNGSSLLGSGDLTVTTSPGGSDTQIQFNDGGVFGGDANFIWNKTDDRLGIQATTPQAPLHVLSATGSGINNVAAGSAMLTAESLPSAPTGSIVKIAMPAAGTGGSGISFVNGGSGTAIGSANGTNYWFRFYPVLVADSIYYKSTNYEELGPTSDPNDAQSYDIQVGNGTVTISGETVEYFVEYSTDGGSYSPLGRTSGSPTYTSLSGSDDTTAWPSYYQNTPGTPPNPFTGGSASGQDVGSGAFTEVPITVLMEVDSVANIGGTDYVSGSPTSGSFDDTGMGTYNPEIAWTDNGAATNAIARISQDGGSTWIYKYTGSSTSPFRFTDMSNDSSAEARWGQTYSAGSVTYDFEPRGIGVSPSGNTVYSVAGATYSATLTADSVKYIFKHTLSGGSGPPYRINAPQASPAYGIQLAGASTYDPGYTTWGNGVANTPTSYGFSGTNQNREYRIYSYDSVLGIYGTTPFAVSTVAGSGSKYVELAWTLPSGVTKVKITRSINGGGFSAGKIVTGSSTTDDSTDGGWTSGTTVTPTSIIPLAARIDLAADSATDQPHLALVDITGSGTRYQKISFGIAADSASSATFQAHISVASNTGYMDLVTGRVNINASLGGATPAVILGNANIFNNAASSTVHFQVKGQNDAGLINTRSDYDTVFFGQTGSGDPSATVRIQPNRSSDLGLGLAGHSGMSSTSVLLRTQNSVGSFGAEITVGGHIWAAQGSTANPGLSFRADPDSGLYNVTTNSVALVLGGTERTRWTTTGAYFGSSAGVNASARIHIQAGTTSASTAPIKLTSGSLMTSPEVGAIEFLTDNLYYTKTTSTARVVIVAALSVPTSGRVQYAGTSGFLQDTANFTYSVNRLSPTYITLGASTASASTGPLKFTSGTLMTTAEAGVFEFLTDKFYATITTGAARKELTLNDAALTSGRVPFATTNGRLTDVADFAFSVDTLTVTKIAAHTLTGNLTVADAVNFVLNATTGTQIGTATSQKLGFYGAAPVDQPATVADPTGGVVVDAESRTAIIAIIDRLQELGLVA